MMPPGATIFRAPVQRKITFNFLVVTAVACESAEALFLYLFRLFRCGKTGRQESTRAPTWRHLLGAASEG